MTQVSGTLNRAPISFTIKTLAVRIKAPCKKLWLFLREAFAIVAHPFPKNPVRAFALSFEFILTPRIGYARRKNGGGLFRPF